MKLSNPQEFMSMAKLDEVKDLWAKHKQFDYAFIHEMREDVERD